MLFGSSILELFCSALNALGVYCWPLESCCAQCSDGFQDELARVLVTLFDSRHLLYQLLWNMFSKEVELADSMQTLFRGNSLASKIMTFCFKVMWNGVSHSTFNFWTVVYVHLKSGFSVFAGVWCCISAEASGAAVERNYYHTGVAANQFWSRPCQACLPG